MLHIFTLNWNGKDKLEKLYPSLINATKNIDYTWWIRDNGSKDGSIDWIQNNIKIKLLNIKHNRGSFAEGVNSLWKLANPSDNDLILLLNNDVEINDKDSLNNMINLLKRTNAEVVGARLLFSDRPEIIQHAGVIFSKRYNNLPYHFRPGEVTDKDALKNREFQAVTAACCIVKASAFKKINGMDEGFCWAFDDIDMCLQIGQFGKIIYCGNTKIFHEESASLKKNPVNKMFMKQNVERFRKKWNGKYEIDHEMYLNNKNYKTII